ncbi:MAG: MogA/MoaB family molybdenum cofactor biosynthesis protein [Lawsonibacter sp.]|jgi:molybdopterin adenylyltransferase|nr:MogA/MoaB family molybdenum cofactor biosynthesis protein [Lawsonibacter sp.]
MRAAVITLSDSGYAGQREDKSGPLIQRLLGQAGYQVVHTAILPDGRQPLADELRRLCDEGLADLILTTGGTGFSSTDQTPEATMNVVERPVPGIPEAMRWYSLRITPRAMLSRAAAGIRGSTLIVNLPGSPKAAEECLSAILPTLAHGLEVLTGPAQSCARSGMDQTEGKRSP